jgi:hypothetical protein
MSHDAHTIAQFSNQMQTLGTIDKNKTRRVCIHLPLSLPEAAKEEVHGVETAVEAMVVGEVTS